MSFTVTRIHIKVQRGAQKGSRTINSSIHYLMNMNFSRSVQISSEIGFKGNFTSSKSSTQRSLPSILKFQNSVNRDMNSSENFKSSFEQSNCFFMIFIHRFIFAIVPGYTSNFANKSIINFYINFHRRLIIIYNIIQISMHSLMEKLQLSHSMTMPIQFLTSL